MIRRAAFVLTLMVHATSAWAQTAVPASDDPAVVFVPRFAFHLSAEHLATDDDRFVWDANFGGELDLVDYGSGRGTFVANYQVVMGEELRRFDPNQGNYILGGSLSWRVSSFELAGVFHHESRHLSDRVKTDPVDWNMMGGRVRHQRAVGRTQIDGRVDVRGVIKKSFVDYRWELDAGIRGDIPIRPGVAGLLVGFGVRHLGVDGTLEREGQTGYRAESGLRLEGRAGALELFVAGERRIDPYPLEFGTAQWVTVGFRLLSR